MINYQSLSTILIKIYEVPINRTVYIVSSKSLIIINQK